MLVPGGGEGGQMATMRTTSAIAGAGDADIAAFSGKPETQAKYEAVHLSAAGLHSCAIPAPSQR